MGSLDDMLAGLMLGKRRLKTKADLVAFLPILEKRIIKLNRADMKCYGLSLPDKRFTFYEKDANQILWRVRPPAGHKEPLNIIEFDTHSALEWLNKELAKVDASADTGGVYMDYAIFNIKMGE